MKYLYYGKLYYKIFFNWDEHLGDENQTENLVKL